MESCRAFIYKNRIFKHHIIAKEAPRYIERGALGMVNSNKVG